MDPSAESLMNQILFQTTSDPSRLQFAAALAHPQLLLMKEKHSQAPHGKVQLDIKLQLLQLCTDFVSSLFFQHCFQWPIWF